MEIVDNTQEETPNGQPWTSPVNRTMLHQNMKKRDCIISPFSWTKREWKTSVASPLHCKASYAISSRIQVLPFLYSVHSCNEKRKRLFASLKKVIVVAVENYFHWCTRLLVSAKINEKQFSSNRKRVRPSLIQVNTLFSSLFYWVAESFLSFCIATSQAKKNEHFEHILEELQLQVEIPGTLKLFFAKPPTR